MAQDKAPLEKKDLKIGFIPITCATPLIMAAPAGLLPPAGPERVVVKTAGWALIRDKMHEQGVRRHALPQPDAAGHLDGPGLQPPCR
jgi:hypothetical protein